MAPSSTTVFRAAQAPNQAVRGTPIADLVIEPGAHDVVFIHGVETQVKTISVEPGKVGHLEVKF